MSSKQKSLCLLGATGSIGVSTQDVVRQHRDKFSIHSMAIHSNWKGLLPALKEFGVKRVCVWEESAYKELKKEFQGEVLLGMEGLLELCCDSDISYVVNGLVGSIGCLPTLKALEYGKQVGLANKETMVMAGQIIRNTLDKHPESRLVPIDSEHSAIFQCLAGRPSSEVENLILTASGGPFRKTPKEEFSKITVKEALNHPTWNMGPKITIDSATMMNKGLEVIEAHHLFQMDFEKIEVVIHPSSTVHSFVQFQDGSLMAQLGTPDMKLPILYAMTYPERWPLNIERLDIAKQGTLEFFPPDMEKFRCIKLAYKAGKLGGVAPAVLNGANEVVVDQFLKEKISFNAIPDTLENILENHTKIVEPSLEDCLEADNWARENAMSFLTSQSLKHA